MARRKRKDKTPAPAVSPPRATPREPSRGTFAVSRANRVLAETLPEIIFSKEKPKAERTRARGLATPPLAVSPPSKASAKKKPARPAPERVALDLDRLPSGCKPRPAASKGDGGSRSFVPWCK